jgi:hypothetical protein
MRTGEAGGGAWVGKGSGKCKYNTFMPLAIILGCWSIFGSLYLDWGRGVYSFFCIWVSGFSALFVEDVSLTPLNTHDFLDYFYEKAIG